MGKLRWFDFWSCVCGMGAVVVVMLAAVELDRCGVERGISAWLY